MKADTMRDLIELARAEIEDIGAHVLYPWSPTENLTLIVRRCYFVPGRLVCYVGDRSYDRWSA